LFRSPSPAPTCLWRLGAPLLHMEEKGKGLTLSRDPEPRRLVAALHANKTQRRGGCDTRCSASAASHLPPLPVAPLALGEGRLISTTGNAKGGLRLPLVLEAVPANERHEAHRHEATRGDRVSAPLHEPQLLLVAGANRDDQPPAVGKLLDKRRRHRRGG